MSETAIDTARSSRSSGSEDGAGSKKLTDLLDDLDQQVEGEQSVSVGDILDAFGTRAFGPLLAFPALLVLTPLGAIPGVPAVFAVFIVLIAGQHLLGRDHPWIPSKILDRAVSAEKWESAREKVDPWARRIDKLIGARLTELTSGAMERIIGAVCILLALMMIPLEAVPFAVFLPGAALLLFGLALSARDGLLVILGMLITAGAGALLYLAALG